MLELSGVHAAYGLSRVLHGVSLEARAGEVVSLLGRNGAGKSTTLKAIMGLVEVTGGGVHSTAADITPSRHAQIARLGVGYVPEDRRIFGDLTVEENLRVGERPGGGWHAARIYQLFPKLGELARRRAGSLSGRRAADAHGGAHAHGQPRAWSCSTSLRRAWPRWSSGHWASRSPRSSARA